MSAENENWDNDFELSGSFAAGGAPASVTGSEPASAQRHSTGSSGSVIDDDLGISVARDAGIQSSLPVNSSALPSPKFMLPSSSSSSKHTPKQLSTDQNEAGLVGIAADKTVIEVWDDDFDLGSSLDNSDDDGAAH